MKFAVKYYDALHRIPLDEDFHFIVCNSLNDFIRSKVLQNKRVRIYIHSINVLKYILNYVYHNRSKLNNTFDLIFYFNKHVYSLKIEYQQFFYFGEYKNIVVERSEKRLLGFTDLKKIKSYTLSYYDNEEERENIVDDIIKYINNNIL